MKNAAGGERTRIYPVAAKRSAPVFGTLARDATTAELHRWSSVACVARALKIRPRVWRRNAVSALVARREMAWESRVFGVPRIHIEVAMVPEQAAWPESWFDDLSGLIPSSAHGSIRIPGQSGALSWALQDRGWRWADLAVEYRFVMAPAAPDTSWRFSKASRSEVPVLARKLGRVLADPREIRTRFSSDPRLRPRASRLYTEWAVAGLTLKRDGYHCVIRTARGRAVGVLTAHTERRSARVELNGVFPGARARGAYAALLGHAIRELIADGAREVLIRTPASNVGVQRVWQKLGGIALATDIVLHRPPAAADRRKNR